MLGPMAQSDCPFCGGTGWRLVERIDANQQAERVVQRNGRSAAQLNDEPKNPRDTWREGQRNDAVLGASTAAPKLSWAVPCDCTGADRNTRNLTRARIPKRYEHCDFENFETDLWDDQPKADAWNKSLSQARIVVEAFARNYPVAGETGILLMGSCGVGKTHLAVAALRQLMMRGHATRFYDYRELLKEIQASYDPEHPVSEMGVLEPVLETEVLLIDDIGASKPSDWALDTMGHILNKRYNDKRVTLLTTNYLDNIDSGSASVRMPSGQAVAAPREQTLTDRLGTRIRSRLHEMCRTVQLIGPDYRYEIRRAGRGRP
jgi:DNA replication protein DnaC